MATALFSERQFSLAGLLKFVAGTACACALFTSLPFIAMAALLAILPIIIIPAPKLRPSIGSQITWIMSALGLGLGSAFLGLISVAVPILWMVLAARRCFLGMTLLAVSSGAAFSAVGAATSYVAGNAAIYGMGLPGSEHGNIDPKFRCRHRTGGCILLGNEWLWIPPHNEVVTFLIRTFGPMRGSYVGPYPERDEAIGLAQKGEPIELDPLEKGTLIVAGEAIKLPEGTRERLNWLGSENHSLRQNLIPSARPPPIRAAIWKDRCLLVWFPSPPASHLQPPPPNCGCVVVIDRETGRSFAAYDHHSELYQLREAVNWGPDDE